MKPWLYRLALAGAVAFLVLTVLNASWIAPEPRGSVKLISHRGVGQVIETAGEAGRDCSAKAIEPVYHDYIENTVTGVRRALAHGAKMAVVDIAATRDGRIAVFRDRSLDCRTDGKGPVREKTMEQLQALDVGYGYSADGGTSFPLRGKGAGQLPELKQVIANIPYGKTLMYHFTSDNPREAELLADALAQAGRDPVKSGDGFYGSAAAVEAIRARFPGVWAFTLEEAQECAGDYVLTGWTSMLPASCEGGTMIIPLNRQFLYWGWPNRLIARMEGAGGKVIIGGPANDARGDAGLTLPEQLGEIPSTFNGYVWVDDSWNIPPSLTPSLDRRTEQQRDAADKAVTRRKDAQ